MLLQKEVDPGVTANSGQADRCSRKTRSIDPGVPARSGRSGPVFSQKAVNRDLVLCLALKVQDSTEVDNRKTLYFLMFWDSLGGLVFLHVPNSELERILLDPDLLNPKP